MLRIFKYLVNKFFISIVIIISPVRQHNRDDRVEQTSSNHLCLWQGTLPQRCSVLLLGSLPLHHLSILLEVFLCSSFLPTLCVGRGMVSCCCPFLIHVQTTGVLAFILSIIVVTFYFSLNKF